MKHKFKAGDLIYFKLTETIYFVLSVNKQGDCEIVLGNGALNNHNNWISNDSISTFYATATDKYTIECISRDLYHQLVNNYCKGL